MAGENGRRILKKLDLQEVSPPRAPSVAKSIEYRSISQKAVRPTSIWVPLG
jgi:hypothetical protein